jgi:hypothetical protein
MTQDIEQSANAAVRVPPSGTPRHEEALIDQALLETFPASDPISPAVEARMDAARERAAGDAARAVWKARMRRLAPTLLTVGATALVLKAMSGGRAASRRRQVS